MFYPQIMRFFGRLFIIFSMLFLTFGTLYLNGYRYYSNRHVIAGIYRLITKENTYRYGDWVFFCPPDNLSMELALQRDYVATGVCPGGFAPVVQQIVATPGDYISLKGIVRVNGNELPQALVLDKDEHNNALPHLSPLILHQNQFFTLDSVQMTNCFDSRYYGPVTSENILASVHLIWIWKDK
ncbi:conjugative transfer signal peptidase TraF [Vibrio harveyi]|uniref:conjugative transfer signal peptidase TraF n=1 Tax=Vibrio harveyi TaxID=669 RepID=UPI002B3842BD|nr:conjugative transfer signal peptidase TraF [Vibrio harveyi]HEQ3598443.1 conjugative transfer signal peptidase TraF [Vibrio harveyi]HEQ3610141.1 conjugative transfer signal peptidase TraF [Vibrio harveyi]